MKILSTKTGRYGERPLSRVRLFVHRASDCPLTARFTNDVQFYRSMVLPQVLTDKLKDVKASWSRAAGCSCGCSPGFILDIHPGQVGYDAIWVTIK